MIGNLMFGTLIDTWGMPIAFSMFGNCLFLAAFSFVGPLPFVDVEPSKQLIQVQTLEPYSIQFMNVYF